MVLVFVAMSAIDYRQIEQETLTSEVKSIPRMLNLIFGIHDTTPAKISQSLTILFVSKTTSHKYVVFVDKDQDESSLGQVEGSLRVFRVSKVFLKVASFFLEEHLFIMKLASEDIRHMVVYDY